MTKCGSLSEFRLGLKFIGAGARPETGGAEVRAELGSAGPGHDHRKLTTGSCEQYQNSLAWVVVNICHQYNKQYYIGRGFLAATAILAPPFYLYFNSSHS